MKKFFLSMVVFVVLAVAALAVAPSMAWAAPAFAGGVPGDNVAKTTVDAPQMACLSCHTVSDQDNGFHAPVPKIGAGLSPINDGLRPIGGDMQMAMSTSPYLGQWHRRASAYADSVKPMTVHRRISRVLSG